MIRAMRALTQAAALETTHAKPLRPYDVVGVVMVRSMEHALREFAYQIREIERRPAGTNFCFGIGYRDVSASVRGQLDRDPQWIHDLCSEYARRCAVVFAVLAADTGIPRLDA